MGKNQIWIEKRQLKFLYSIKTDKKIYIFWNFLKSKKKS